MDFDNHDEYKLDHAASRLPNCESVGLFSHRTPADEVEDSDLHEAMQLVLHRLSPELRELLADTIEKERQEAQAEATLQLSALFSRILSYCLFPLCWTKLFGVIYSFDLPQHNEVPPSETARRLGCTRSAISFAMQDAARTFNLPPSRWMRGDSAVRSSTHARNLFVEQASSAS